MKYTIYSIIIWLTVSGTANALYIEQIPSTTSGNLSFVIYLAAPGAEQNAVSGQFVFNSNYFELDSISTNDSIVTVWSTLPVINRYDVLNAERVVEFKGEISEGFRGVIDPLTGKKSSGKIFTINLKSRKEGQTEVKLRNGYTYGSNGARSVSKLYSEEISILSPIPTRNSSDVKGAVLITSDTLIAQVMTDKNLTDSKLFVFFYEDNSKRPVDHFEIAESYNSDPENIYSWRQAISPYLLLDQDRNSFIHLKAIYKDGTYAYKTIQPVEKIGLTVFYRGILNLVFVFLMTAVFYGIFSHIRSKLHSN